MSKKPLLCALVGPLLVVSAVVGCGNREGAPSGGATGGIPAGPTTDIQVVLRDNLTIAASPATLRAGPVKITVTNEGGLSHGLGIEGLGLEQNVPPGRSVTREEGLPAATYVLYCPIADHRERGMHAELKVQ